MKFCTVSLFFALLVAVCLPAVAQTEVRLDIPFNFIAAGQSLPAGHYTVVPVFHNDRAAWRISNDHDSVMVLTNSLESPQTAHRPSLVFFYAGEAYSLVQIWPGGQFGRDVPRSNVKQTLVAQDGKDGKYVEIGAE